MKLKFCLTLTFIMFSVLYGSFTTAQDSTISLAFKKNRTMASYPMFYTPDLAYKLQQQFQLIKLANGGDPLAQHELGLRFLQGIDSSPDTIKAAEWIKKAAEKELPSACYNYGILLLNGWGVKWNPFEAFLNFKKAAEEGMAQAQYITGMFYTESLVVQRDFNEAFRWIKKAEEQGYEPAFEVLNELREKKLVDDSSMVTSIPKNRSINNSPLVFIDFDMETDTTQTLTEEDLSKALFLSGNEELIQSGKTNTDSDSSIDLSKLNKELLMEAANAGCPEALTISGYFYESGKYFERDMLMSGICYYLGAKLDSRHSAYQLWKLSRSPGFFNELQVKVRNNEPEALFLLYGLKNYEFTDIISGDQAKDFLLKAAASGYNNAELENALNILSGRYEDYSRDRAIEIIKRLMLAGNLTAEQRFISISIIDSSHVNSGQLDRLFFAESKGSVISETLIGYCYSKGIGIGQDTGAAVKYLRRAAQRGSVFALKELEAIHNSIRPPDDIFNLN